MGFLYLTSFGGDSFRFGLVIKSMRTLFQGGGTIHPLLIVILAFYYLIG
jgi:hypothetical protein